MRIKRLALIRILYKVYKLIIRNNDVYFLETLRFYLSTRK